MLYAAHSCRVVSTTAMLSAHSALATKCIIDDKTWLYQTHCHQKRVVLFSWSWEILLQMIQTRQSSHYQPWEKIVKVYSAFMSLWRLTCCVCRNHHCSASRQLESQITAILVVLSFSFVSILEGPIFNSAFILLGYNTATCLNSASVAHIGLSQREGWDTWHVNIWMDGNRCVSNMLYLKPVSLFLAFVIKLCGFVLLRLGL